MRWPFQAGCQQSIDHLLQKEEMPVAALKGAVTGVEGIEHGLRGRQQVAWKVENGYRYNNGAGILGIIVLIFAQEGQDHQKPGHRA